MEFSSLIASIKALRDAFQALLQIKDMSISSREKRANDAADIIKFNCGIIAQNYIEIIGKMSPSAKERRYPNLDTLSDSIETLRKEREEFASLRRETEGIIAAFFEEGGSFYGSVSREQSFREFLKAAQNLFTLSETYRVDDAGANIAGWSATSYVIDVYHTLEKYGEGILIEPDFIFDTVDKVVSDVETCWLDISKKYEQYKFS